MELGQIITLTKTIVDQQSLLKSDIVIKDHPKISKRLVQIEKLLEDLSEQIGGIITTEEMSRRQKMFDSLETEIKNNQTKLDEIEGKIEQSGIDLTEMEEDEAKLKKSLADLQKMIKLSEITLEKNNHDIRLTDNVIEKNKASVDNFQLKLKECEKQLIPKKAGLDEIDTQIKQKHLDLEQVQNQRSQLEGEVRQQQMKIEDITVGIKQKEDDKIGLENHIKELGEVVSGIEKTKEEKVRELGEVVSGIEKTKEEKKLELNKVEVEITKKQEELKQIFSAPDLAKLKLDVQDLITSLTNQKMVLDSFKHDLNQSRSDNKLLEMNLSKQSSITNDWSYIDQFGFCQIALKSIQNISFNTGIRQEMHVHHVYMKQYIINCKFVPKTFESYNIPHTAISEITGNRQMFDSYCRLLKFVLDGITMIKGTKLEEYGNYAFLFKDKNNNTMSVIQEHFITKIDIFTTPTRKDSTSNVSKEVAKQILRVPDIFTYDGSIFVAIGQCLRNSAKLPSFSFNFQEFEVKFIE